MPKLYNIGNKIKKMVGIEGGTKETIVPMITYSTMNIGTAASSMVLSHHYTPYLTFIEGLSVGQTTLIASIRSVWDAIIDPFIGFFIDRTRSSLGPHRIYILLAAIPYGLSYFMRWNPFGIAQNGNISNLMMYYFIAQLVYATFDSILNLSHGAMLPAITKGYFERTQYNSMMYIMNAVGMAPTQLISAAVVGIKSTQEYTPALRPTLLKLALLMAVVATITTLISGATTKERSTKHDVFPQADVFLFFRELKQVFKNRAFRQYFTVIFLYLFGSSFSGLSSAFFLRYVAERWDLRSQLQLAEGFEAAAFPVNYALTKKFGKQKCAQITTPLLYVSMGLGLIIKPQKGGGIPWMTIFLFARSILSIVGYSGFGFTLSNIFPDVTDVDEMITGRRREATIATFRSFINTMTGGFMVHVVGMILEWFGVTQDTAKSSYFEARATDLHPALTRTFGLRLSNAFIPLIFLTLSLRSLRNYKMTKKDHELITRVIKERKENGFAEISDKEKATLENISGQSWTDMWVGQGAVVSCQ